MKIRRIHTQVAIMSKEHKFSFDVSQHKLEYFPELNMFKIDETLVPISNIREVLLEQEQPREEGPAQSSQVSNIHQPASPKDVVTQKVKAAQPKSEEIVSSPEVVENWYVAVPDKPAKEVKIAPKRKAQLKSKL
ncbi:MAG: hypothetical protein JWL77_6787 [Chthonomonadaceae bacterium]|nr:hypothetical protein [Chthonomonadaceae bacterium]